MPRFLDHRTLWRELKSRSRRSRRVDAAVAYLGRDAASLLRWRSGSTVLADISEETVARVQKA